jgi:hypothetical protein
MHIYILDLLYDNHQYQLTFFIYFFIFIQEKRRQVASCYKRTGGKAPTLLIQRAFKYYRWCGKSNRRKKKQMNECV